MSRTPGLIDDYDLVIFDLDGVVYLGHQPIDGAVAAINELIRADRAVAYATNNASRRADEVAALLVSLGIVATAAEVVTAAQAAARLLATRLPPAAAVLVVGGAALVAEVREVGLTPVAAADDRPVAVVQGYAPDVGWAQLAEACVAVRGGAWWCATNGDRTLPSPRGPLPGNGSLVAALATALDRQPDVVVGKPAPALFTEAAQRVDARRPVVVGDRLDTDIAGAVNAGMDSVLVLTGVSTAADLLAAPPGSRPTWVARDLSGLRDGSASAPVHPADDRAIETASGGWRVRRHDAGLELTGAGTPMAALAGLAAMAWVVAGEVPEIGGGDVTAAAALRALGLAN